MKSHFNLHPCLFVPNVPVLLTSLPGKMRCALKLAKPLKLVLFPRPLTAPIVVCNGSWHDATSVFFILALAVKREFPSFRFILKMYPSLCMIVPSGGVTVGRRWIMVKRLISLGHFFNSLPNCSLRSRVLL